MDRFKLSDGYSISRVIKGSWQLAGGHGPVDPSAAIAGMRDHVEAGITTFDCADIYTGVEELIGRFLRDHADVFRAGELLPVQVHTKCVPDLDRLAALRECDVVATVDRSLRRLGVERLDLVQLHWWDFGIPGHVEAAHWLARLRRAGKIRLIGLTNADVPRLREVVEAGVPIASNQVQYSVLDRRPQGAMTSFCRERGISLLCYGTVAGGLLGDRYLGAPEPASDAKDENRSLTKYRLIVDEFGGWNLYQDLLRTLSSIAVKHGASIAQVATRYVLDRPCVGAAIVGARNDRHLAETRRLFDLLLDAEDLARIAEIVDRASGPSGPIYGLERTPGGRHAVIMRTDLQRPDRGQAPSNSAPAR